MAVKKKKKKVRKKILSGASVAMDRSHLRGFKDGCPQSTSALQQMLARLCVHHLPKLRKTTLFAKFKA